MFFVHNRVQSLVSMTTFIKSLVPEARVVMAHGQMGERELESVMVKFVDGQADVLVSTAIVESGLDIPASNTIIINRADRFGLAQLYQLRGRVGRERMQAHAYLMVPADGRLDETAQRRLQVIEELTELGAGFKLALRDLEIRGAGNLLGAQQHGHIAAVGFDLYTKLLEEAVRELRGEAATAEVDPTITVEVEALLPEAYVPEENQRLALYKRLAELASPGRNCGNAGGAGRSVRAATAGGRGAPRCGRVARCRAPGRRRAGGGAGGAGAPDLRALHPGDPGAVAGGDHAESRKDEDAEGVHPGSADPEGRLAGGARGAGRARWRSLPDEADPGDARRRSPPPRPPSRSRAAPFPPGSRSTAATAPRPGSVAHPAAQAGHRAAHLR